MDVVVWLRSLGLEKYEPVFRENEIDVDVLPELTELDLEKLGVPLGHRNPHSPDDALISATLTPIQI